MHVIQCASQPAACIVWVQVAAGVSCVGWMAVSSGLIMLNKHLMSTDGFHFPMALSFLGMGFSSVASYFACRARPQLPLPGGHKAGRHSYAYLQRCTCIQCSCFAYAPLWSRMLLAAWG